jgi:hypothetical protein
MISDASSDCSGLDCSRSPRNFAVVDREEFDIRGERRAALGLDQWRQRSEFATGIRKGHCSEAVAEADMRRRV